MISLQNRMVCKALIKAAMCMVSLLAASRYLDTVTEIFHLPPQYKQHGGKCECSNIDCVMQGRWVQRENITQAQRNQLDILNKRIASKKKLKTKGRVRLDGRCGHKYPVKNQASQCDGFSSKPCCNTELATCGNTTQHCKCGGECINYNVTLRHADLHHWEDQQCPTEQQFHRNHTCNLLKQHFSSVSFFGDSLIKHFFGALVMHLTDDYVYGGLMPNLNPRLLEICKGEKQFALKDCKINSIRKWEDIKNNPKYCQNTQKKIKLSFSGAYDAETAPILFGEIHDVLAERRPLIVVGAGVHENYNATIYKYRYLKPLLKRTIVNKRAVIVWVSSPPVTDLKPNRWLHLQKNSAVENFNREMKRFCTENKVAYFDVHEISQNIYSFDGTHYGVALNAVKVRLFIKFIKFLMT